jgi:predicted ATPase/DNA-binding CsgD family transcriptional regulator
MVREAALVPGAVCAALGVRQASGMPVLESLVAVLARRQLLVVLDNCEHLLMAVAELCGALLPVADDVRILATSREPVGVAGEARYRLAPLTLPDDLAGIGGSEAVALFADRARRVDSHFALGGESGPAVARLVQRLDGMPLAIELAAARVEALGVAGLADRLDDRFALLAGGDRLAADRHRSLTATAQWSYELLGGRERQVFRQLAVFPGPFTLEAAEAVAGADAGSAVLHLVDCSLVDPPRAGPDGRARYLMLDTLRAYGSERLAEAGEGRAAAAALARFTVGMARQAAAGLETGAGEVDAARWLDGEDATVHGVLTGALEHDPATAVRLAVALGPWWFVRGRWAPGYELLSAATGHATGGGQPWCAAQFWLGVLTSGSSVTASFSHLTAARDALAGRPPAVLLARVVAWRAGALANLGRVGEAAEEGRHALAMARELGDAVAEISALYWLAAAARYVGDLPGSRAWLQQAQQMDRASAPGWIARQCDIHLAEALGELGETADAQRHCGEALAAARTAGALYDQGDCLLIMAGLDVLAGRLAEARAHLRETLDLFSLTGANVLLFNCLTVCGDLCAATQHWREAITAWAARDAATRAWGSPGQASGTHQREESLRQARAAIGPVLVDAAAGRGAAMTVATAAEYARLLVTEEPEQPAASPGLPRLSARERELVTLVAQGRTNAQIAGQLFISVRTVSSHLDRIRDKTGCRRRADLTRLALQAGLV